MRLNELRDNLGARKKPMRVGRGIGSGKGKTAGRGQKGQKSRSGVAIKGFEGGQMPLYRRLPRRGFNNPMRLDYAIINLGDLQRLIERKKLAQGSVVSLRRLQEIGAVKGRYDGLRVLAKGSLSLPLTIHAAGASAAARAGLEAAGGTLVIANKSSQVSAG